MRAQAERLGRLSGRGDLGLVGDGTRNIRTAPGANVEGLGDVVQLSPGGAYNVCGLRAGGTLMCWGRGNLGELGNGSAERKYRPTLVKGLTGVVEVSGGQHFMCALDDTGAVHCWGSNSRSQLGRSAGEPRFVTTPNRVGFIDDAISLELGGYHVCAERRGGTVLCWGAGGSGQLGNGETNRAYAMPVEL